jgi:uncharacterized protein
MRYAHSSLAASAVARATAKAAPLRRAALRRLALAATLLLPALAAHASPPADLYHCRAFVTGQGEAERARGFGLCLEAVLVKVSGDPHLRGDPRLAPMKQVAAGFVAGFTYRDRMAGLPLHDEQGTRDRPFDLTVAFDPPKIDAALHKLGLAAWPSPRPVLAIFLGVRDAKRAYVLTEDGERGLGERLSLHDAAAQRGIPLVLPKAPLAAEEHLTYAGLAAASVSRRRALAGAIGGDAALAGSLAWSEAARGWTARWRLAWQGRDYHWRISGVSFDDAFRDALDRAAAILSGHGA